MSFLFEELTREECEAIREEDGYMRGLEEGEAKGKAEGKAEGHKEGKIEEQHDIAVKMLEMGLETAVIAEATGLSEEEISDLKKL